MEKINGLPKSKVLKKLENDNDYYGEFGKNFYQTQTFMIY